MRLVLRKTAKARVRAGALEMDRQENGIQWADEIDKQRFELKDEYQCVLGFVDGVYDEGVSARFGGNYLVAQSLGFDTYHGYHGRVLTGARRDEYENIRYTDANNYDSLQEAWHFEIATRQATLAERRRTDQASAEASLAIATMGPTARYV